MTIIIVKVFLSAFGILLAMLTGVASESKYKNKDTAVGFLFILSVLFILLSHLL